MSILPQATASTNAIASHVKLLLRDTDRQSDEMDNSIRWISLTYPTAL